MVFEETAAITTRYMQQTDSSTTQFQRSINQFMNSHYQYCPSIVNKWHLGKRRPGYYEMEHLYHAAPAETWQRHFAREILSVLDPDVWQGVTA